MTLSPEQIKELAAELRKKAAAVGALDAYIVRMTQEKARDIADALETLLAERVAAIPEGWLAGWNAALEAAANVAMTAETRRRYPSETKREAVALIRALPPPALAVAEPEWVRKVRHALLIGHDYAKVENSTTDLARINEALALLPRERST